MRRLHLFEFGDQPWFPQILRDAETAYLATSYRILPVLARLWAERISTVLPAGAPAEILDLCSGTGGPMPAIVAELEKRGCQARVTLTDLYSNPKFPTHQRIVWLAEPVDATRVSPNLAGVRTAPVAILVGLILEALKYVNLALTPLIEAKLEHEYFIFRHSGFILLWSFVAALIVLAGAEWTARHGREDPQEDNEQPRGEQTMQEVSDSLRPEADPGSDFGRPFSPTTRTLKKHRPGGLCHADPLS